MSKLTLNEREQTDVQLMQTAEQILSKMTAEAVLFPTPVPDLEALQSALTAFRNSATEAAFHDSRAILIRNQKRKDLVYILKELSKYVDTIAKDDDATVLAAGFSLRKVSDSYKGLVPKAQRPIAEHPQIGIGRILLRTEPWTGARMYDFQYRIKDSAEDWKSQLSSKSTCTIDGLETFKEYEFRTTYIGIYPTPNFSDILSAYVF